MGKMSEKVSFSIVILLLLILGGVFGYKIATMKKSESALVNQPAQNVAVQNTNTASGTDELVFGFASAPLVSGNNVIFHGKASAGVQKISYSVLDIETATGDVSLDTTTGTWSVSFSKNQYPGKMTIAFTATKDGVEYKAERLYDPSLPPQVSSTATVVQVNWQKQVDKVSSASVANALGVPLSDVESSSAQGSSSTFYKVGTVTSANYAGDDFLLVSTFCDNMPCMYPTVTRMIVDPKTKHLVNVVAYGGAVWGGNSAKEVFQMTNANGETLPTLKPPGNIVVDDADITIPGMTLLDTYTLENSSYTIKLSETQDVEIFGQTLSPDGKMPDVKVAWKTTDGRDVYSSSNSGCLYLLKPDLTFVKYELVIPFRSASLLLNINWTAGGKNSSDYSFADFGGCGAVNCYAVRNEAGVKSATRLVQVGTTSTGEKIYGLKDANDKELKDFYAAYKGTPSDPSNIASYNTMVANHPIIYWKDPLNRWVRLAKTMYTPAVECGKPVIYLYPEKEMSVHVAIGLKGKMTASEPAYGTRGWSVIAEPNGYVKNVADGLVYPNLYWEGTGVNYTVPTQGFVVKGTETDAWLKKTLATIGFTERESQEFREFWVPRLPHTPYVFITFVPQENFDRDARLMITPAPQHVTRVFMEYHGLNAQESVEPLVLPHIVRDGFSVVEWGGALRK